MLKGYSLIGGIYVKIISMDQTDKPLTKKEKKELRKQEKLEELDRYQFQERVKKIIIWITILVGTASILFAVVKLSSPKSKKTVNLAINSSDHTKGDRNSKVILFEYSDFQCPACAFYLNYINRLDREIGNKILFVYRHYPLSQHKNAKLAAYASEAAGKQDKFWEMHDLLFANQKVWSEQNNSKNIFSEYAKSLKLDMKKFEQDLESQEVKGKIEDDSKSGDEFGIFSTPTFILNGRKMEDTESYEGFKKSIEQEIVRSDSPDSNTVK